MWPKTLVPVLYMEVFFFVFCFVLYHLLFENTWGPNGQCELSVRIALGTNIRRMTQKPYYHTQQLAFDLLKQLRHA